MSQKLEASTLLDQHNSRLRFLDQFIPEIILRDVSESFKARILIIMVSILLLLAVVSMSLVIFIDQSLTERRLITIALISLQPLSIWLMRLKKRTKEASWYVVSLLAITAMYIDYSNQSFKGVFSIIWMLPTTITVMLLGGKAALKVTMLSILGLSLNFILLKQGLLPTPITPPEKWLDIEFIISISVMLVVTFSAYVLSSMARQKEMELSKEIESRKVIAKELEEAKNTAEQAASNKSMFLATMSHELRTPLNSILGNAELLSRQQLEGKTELRVNDIYASGQLLISIINDILDLSKFDTYGIELSNETYDISEQLKRIHRIMTPKLKPEVSFVLEGAEKANFIDADQNRLSQVILNLVSNAVKFTEQGHITLSLICESEKGILIKVADTGVGISPEDAKNLFQDFVQVRKHANRQVEGTGLGLAIIQRIVKKMHGSICLDSAEGKGSIFTVSLPIDIKPIELNENTQIFTKDEGSTNSDLSKLSVLIVDDVPMNCIILTAQLEELGMTQITEKHDGEEALELIKQGKQFDAILMDVRMPKMDGIEATKLIRELSYNKPIIAVTANAFEEDKHACLDAGMSGFLSKPLELDKLKDVMLRISRQ